VSVVVYGSGMLIALIGRERRALALHKGVVDSGGHAPIIPGPALSQVWRTSPKTAYGWKRLLAESVACPPGSISDEGSPARCLPCASGMGIEDRKTLGDMIGSATLEPKKRPDPVDALAVLIAAKHGGGTVLTSDAGDIDACVRTIPGCGVNVVAV
jgi:hypothetical protein